MTRTRTLNAGILERINRIRAAKGLVALTFDRQLAAASAEHCEQMAVRGYFAHASVDGTAFWSRIRSFYPAAGHQLWSVGENLLWSSRGLDPSQALRVWMASPEHRANILDPAWRQIGIAAVRVTDAPGVYHGRDTTIVTADFGVRG